MRSRNGTVLTRCAILAALPPVALAGCANTTVLSSDDAAFRPGGQSGATADVTHALCDRGREITRVSGTVVTAQESPRGLVQGFDVIRDQLCQSLYPGANDPFSTSKN